MTQAQAALLAGASSTAVSPAAGTYIAGDDQNRKFTGTHDDIFIKALVLHDGENSLAFVTMDCIGLIGPTIEAMQDAAAQAMADNDTISLSKENIIISSTHGHSGPDVVGLWGPEMGKSGVDPKYIEHLVATAAAQVAQAVNALQPATLRTATTQSKVDWVKNICEPKVLDRGLSIFQLNDKDGKCIATATNFACHPTILDGVHDVVSADWIGGLYRAMDEALGGEHLFFQGAVGGWIQPAKGNRSFDLADRYGRELAAEALAALKDAPEQANATIACASKTLQIPVENPIWKALADMGMFPHIAEDVVNTRVATFRIGDLEGATHPAETPPAYSESTREWLDAPKTMVIGLGLDALGYILPPKHFARPDNYPFADYLTSMSLGPQAGPTLLKALEDLITAQN